MQRAKVLKRIGSENGSNGAVLEMACLGSLLNLNCHRATYFQGLQVEGFADEDPAQNGERGVLLERSPGALFTVVAGEPEVEEGEERLNYLR